MRIWTASIILLCAACTIPPDEPWGLSLVQPELRWEDDRLEIEAALAVDLSPAAIEALEHGVPLTLLISTRARRDRPGVPSRSVMHRHALELRYLPLSRHWQVTDLETGIDLNFPRLWMLTAALGEQRRFTTGLDRDALDDHAWRVRIRAELDRSALPSPMRLPAWFSNEWRLSSPWHTWHLDPA